METNMFFYILMVAAMISVLVSLFIGLFAMARRGEDAKKLSQKMMRARVILQGVAIICFILAVTSAKS
jgi:heme/copper-type cytochrome/quinol oxidase subunit 2